MPPRSNSWNKLPGGDDNSKRFKRGATLDSLKSTTASNASGMETDEAQARQPRRWGIMASLLRTVTTRAASSAFDDPENAVIIFDWDDTLCPTWWANSARSSLEDLTPLPELQQHASVVESTIRAAREVARVAIVTLAGRDWFHASSKWLMPGIDFRALMDELDISVYYCAVKPLGKADTLDPLTLAKKRAMQKCLQTLYGRIATSPRWNVLSIGDSTVEQQALKDLLGDGSKGLCKTLKLAGQPTLEQLTGQLQTVQPMLGKMMQYDKAFDRTSSSLWFSW